LEVGRREKERRKKKEEKKKLFFVWGAFVCPAKRV
jgi:hypothetical protein